MRVFPKAIVLATKSRFDVKKSAIVLTSNASKNFITVHEHFTRDSGVQRLISTNQVLTEQNHREPP